MEKFHRAIQSTGYRFPLTVQGLLVINVNDIDFFHFAPRYAPPVIVGDTVGGQVGDLDTDLVVAGFQAVLEIKDERHTPGAADEQAVDIDPG